MDRLDSRVGVVDRGRKRPQRDADELPHAEADVLLQGALVTDPDTVLNGGGQRRWVGRLLLKGGAPCVRDRAAQHDMLAHLENDLHADPELLGEREQSFGVDGLHIPVPAGPDRDRPHRMPGRLARPRTRAQAG